MINCSNVGKKMFIQILVFNISNQNMTFLEYCIIFPSKVSENSAHSEITYIYLVEATCKSAKCSDPLIRWITNHSDIVSIRLPVCIFKLFYIKIVIHPLSLFPLGLLNFHVTTLFLNFMILIPHGTHPQCYRQ